MESGGILVDAVQGMRVLIKAVIEGARKGERADKRQGEKEMENGTLARGSSNRIAHVLLDEVGPRK